jgi:predicted enzyme related to lactoylglutathione lyase
MKVLRVLARIYLDPADLNETVEFYEKLFGVECDLRLKYAEVGLELTGIGPVLLIAGSEERLRNFRQTQATFLVDSIDDFRNWLLGAGAVILEEPKKVPTGRNMRVRHPDGTVIEYVEHIRRSDKTT